MQVHRGCLEGGDQALELALAHALVRRASVAGGEVLRLYRPSAPVVVFGRRDTRLPGFAAAVRAVEEARFTPLVRATGGRVVAYTARAIVVDHVRHEPGSTGALDHRFAQFGELLATALRTLGVDARVGAVPGEYCPGVHSVNARGAVKLVGTAQRVLKDAWLFSSLVMVEEEESLRPLLATVYRHLDLHFDEASVGSIATEHTAVRPDDVERALLETYAVASSPVTELDPSTLTLARELADQHRVRPPAGVRGAADRRPLRAPQDRPRRSRSAGGKPART